MKKFSNGCVRLMQRWLPDAFLFAIILTIIVYVAAIAATGLGPIAMVEAWASDSGFWSLLSFSMQMALVCVTGTAFAQAPIMKKILDKIASLAHNKLTALLVICYVSGIANFLNWGFGLVVGALVAKAVVKRNPDLDYPLMIAAAYAGFLIWHAGLSGSIPLDLSAGKVFGEVTYQAGLNETILHPMNLIMVLVYSLGLPFVMLAQHPDEANTKKINPAMLVDEEVKKHEINTPADKMENSKILWGIVVLAGLVHIVYYFVTKGFNLGLNIVNFIFMFVGILAHGSLRSYIDAFADATVGASGVLLQFPFYAGIMGMMTAKNDAGVCLAAVLSNFFVNISTNVTFPMFSFLAAGVVNFFVPSGGGQWAVQGPIMMPAGRAIYGEGHDGITAMAVAWGDQWTNMIQPFWALPALGVAGLGAKDIMGYLVTVTIYAAIIACIGFVCWATLFI